MRSESEDEELRQQLKKPARQMVWRTAAARKPSKLLPSSNVTAMILLPNVVENRRGSAPLAPLANHILYAGRWRLARALYESTRFLRFLRGIYGRLKLYSYLPGCRRACSCLRTIDLFFSLFYTNNVKLVWFLVSVYLPLALPLLKYLFRIVFKGAGGF